MMANLDGSSLARYFRTQDDWTGRTPGEVRRALEWAIWKQCYANLSESEWQQVLPMYESTIDFAMYCMASVQFPFQDRPEWTLQQANEHFEGMNLDRSAKRNFLVGYLNPYWYRYIHDVELAKLDQIFDGSPGVSDEYVVDYFLTTIIFVADMMANPGLQFEYHQIPGISASRVGALEELRGQILDARRRGDEPALFRLLFYAMTHFAGSVYRGVHKGLMVELYGCTDLGEVRQIFDSNVESLIQNKGNISLGRVNPW